MQGRRNSKELHSMRPLTLVIESVRSRKNKASPGGARQTPDGSPLESPEKEQTLHATDNSFKKYTRRTGNNGVRHQRGDSGENEAKTRQKRKRVGGKLLLAKPISHEKRGPYGETVHEKNARQP